MLALHELSGVTVERLRRAGLDVASVLVVIDLALTEDLVGSLGPELPPGAAGVDLTSVATIPADQRSRATFGARVPGVVAGSVVAAAVIERVCGPTASEVEVHIDDGESVAAGQTVASVEAPTRSLLTAERTALNLLGHLSGVATLTRRWTDALVGTRARVRDTRKTMPGLRALEKYAVRCGGGVNHRFGLHDAALIKDNHVAAAGGITAAYRRVVERFPEASIEVEVDSLDGLREALAIGAREVLLDNFGLDQLTEAVQIRDRTAPSTMLEASGGLTIETARAVAETGVDFIAVGELTHSARVLDIGLDFVEVR